MSQASGLKEFNPEQSDLQSLEAAFWHDVEAAADQVTHPWAFIALSTLTPSGPHQRLLVLRACDPLGKKLFFHSDRRSPKIGQIRNSPRVSLLIYDAQSRLQISMTGAARVILEGAVFESAWQKTPTERLKNYLGVRAPGTPARTASRNLPASVQATGDAGHLSEIAAANFSVIEVELDFIEFLWLQPSGNLRAVVKKYDDEWIQSWIEP